MITIRDAETGEVILQVEPNDLPGKSLQGVRLASCDFIDLDLSRVVLSYSSLRQINFRGSSLLNAALNNTFMVNVCFDGAIMDGVEMKQPPYRDRRIFAEVRVSSDEARFQIRHDGEANALLGNEVFESPHLLERPECRAYVLIQSFLDEFDVDAEGRCLTLVKRR